VLKLANARVFEFWVTMKTINSICIGQNEIDDVFTLRKFPRYGYNIVKGEKKYLITVANCVSCGEQASKKERTNPEMIFCDKECQSVFYQNKNFRK
jgi:hypothetical protein